MRTTAGHSTYPRHPICARDEHPVLYILYFDILKLQMTAQIAALEKHECPACGAQAEWNPSTQKLVCPFCGPSPVPDRSRAGQGRRARSGQGPARAARRGSRMADRAAKRPVPVLSRGHGVRSRAGRPELRVLRLAGPCRLSGDPVADPSTGRPAVSNRRRPCSRRHPPLVEEPMVRAWKAGARGSRRHDQEPLHPGTGRSTRRCIARGRRRRATTTT